MEQNQAASSDVAGQWSIRADLLAARLRAVENELALAVPQTPEWSLARERLEDVAAELDIALRHLADQRFLVDQPPEATQPAGPRLAPSLRQFARARLGRAHETARARRRPDSSRGRSIRW